MNKLLSSIESSINNTVNEYNKVLSDKFDIDIEELKNITSSNRKNCIQECKEMIRNVQDTTSKKYIRTVQPDVDLTFTSNSGEEVAIPINLSFFWPDA